MILYEPWAYNAATPKFQWDVFDKAATARTDMQWFLDNSPLDLSRAPQEFRTRAKDGNLILTSGADAVFARSTGPRQGRQAHSRYGVPQRLDRADPVSTPDEQVPDEQGPADPVPVAQELEGSGWSSLLSLGD